MLPLSWWRSLTRELARYTRKRKHFPLGSLLVHHIRCLFVRTSNWKRTGGKRGGGGGDASGASRYEQLTRATLCARLFAFLGSQTTQLNCSVNGGGQAVCVTSSSYIPFIRERWQKNEPTAKNIQYCCICSSLCNPFNSALSVSPLLFYFNSNDSRIFKCLRFVRNSRLLCVLLRSILASL